MTEIFFVECDAIINGRRIGFWAERDPKSNGRGSTVLDIKTGQLENVRRVLSVDLEINWSEDVSEDIAREVLALFASDREEPTGSVLDFLEEHLGVEAIADFSRELEAA
jgi:hypothetical protein